MTPSRDSLPTVVITGSTGWIGSRTIPALAPGYRTIGIDDDPPTGEPAPDEFFKCDLTSDDEVRRTLERVAQSTDRIASVIHLAAYYDFSGEPSPLYEDLTVEGTRRLLTGLAELDVEQFVFSSSVLVMKPSEDGELIDETSELEALWDYPQSKIDAERVVADTHGDVPAVVLRIAGVYGDDCHSIPLAQQARRIWEKRLESYLFPGNPEHGQPFVHVDDVAACIACVVDLRDSLEPLEVFLVGEPDRMSYGELQDAIGEILHGKKWPTIRIPPPVAKAGAWLKAKLPDGDEQFIKPWMVDLADADYPIDIARARERLGWHPRHRLAAELPAMLEGLHSDPSAWYAQNGLDPSNAPR